MIAIIIVLVILLGLVYFQVFTQGIFSCFIMMVWTIISAMVALNYQDYLAMLMIDNGLGFYPKAVALLAPFIITLFVLREISDRFIPGNMRFPELIDRAGSTLFALVTSLIITGMVSLCFQNLPLPTQILGFERMSSLEDLDEQKTWWPGGDGLIVSTLNQASAYCFAGDRSYDQVHPEYLRELHMNRIVPENHEGSKKFAPSGSITVKNAKVRQGSIQLVTITPATNRSAETRKPAGKLEKGSGELISITIDINARPSEKENVTCKDVDGNIRFALSQFRLVGHSEGKDTIECFPSTVMIGSNTGEQMGLDDGKIYTAAEEIELIFQWPTSVKSVAPEFIEFKNTCRAIIPNMGGTKKKEENDTAEEPVEGETEIQ